MIGYSKKVLDRALKYLTRFNYASLKNIAGYCLVNFRNQSEMNELLKIIEDDYIEKCPHRPDCYQLSKKGYREFLSRYSFREMWLMYNYPDFSENLIETTAQRLDKGQPIKWLKGNV